MILSLFLYRCFEGLVAGMIRGSTLLMAIPLVILALYIRSVGISQVLQGGCILDTGNQRLIRWWGIFFPFRSLEIPWSSISEVRLSYGLHPNGIRAAHDGDVKYNLAVEHSGRLIVVRQNLHDYHQAVNAGFQLADILSTVFVDGTRKPVR